MRWPGVQGSYAGSQLRHNPPFCSPRRYGNLPDRGYWWTSSWTGRPRWLRGKKWTGPKVLRQGLNNLFGNQISKVLGQNSGPLCYARHRKRKECCQCIICRSEWHIFCAVTWLGSVNWIGQSVHVMWLVRILKLHPGRPTLNRVIIFLQTNRCKTDF